MSNKQEFDVSPNSFSTIKNLQSIFDSDQDKLGFEGMEVPPQ
jgi:hypothetical protein